MAVAGYGYRQQWEEGSEDEKDARDAEEGSEGLEIERWCGRALCFPGFAGELGGCFRGRFGVETDGERFSVEDERDAYEEGDGFENEGEDDVHEAAYTSSFPALLPRAKRVIMIPLFVEIRESGGVRVES